ncbi:MAG: glycosyltransferase family 4 protein [Anaerolineae bacterium]
MNILMLSSSYPKFHGDVTAPFIESIATHIAAQGHCVHILLPEHRDLRRAPFEDGIYFHTYRYALRREWTNWGYAESLRADVKVKGNVYGHVPAVFASALLALEKLTAREHFDVIHAHWVLPNAPMAALVAAQRHIPLVISLHGSDVFLAAKVKPLGAVAHWCLDRAAGITACSANLMTGALALGAAEDRLEMIPYGADIKAFHVDPAEAARVRASLGVQPDDLLVLAVGRLVYKKGFAFLVQAMREVLLTAPHARLVIAGDGDLRQELAQHAASLGLNGNVTFTGSVSHQAIAALYAAADIFVVPSVHDEAGNVDGLPNVTLEAMAAGKPVIASRVAGLPQVVQEGVNGLLVEEKDVPALAQAILTLASDPALRQRMGAASRVQIRESLNWDNVAAKFVKMYERATKMNP